MSDEHEPRAIDQLSDRDRGEFDWDRLGRILKHYRTKSGLRQEDLVKITGVPLTVLSNLERGRASTVENLIPICVEIGINPCKLHSHFERKAATAAANPIKQVPEPKPAANPMDIFTAPAKPTES